MAFTVTATDEYRDAYRRMRDGDTQGGRYVFGIEFDPHKEPYPHRVMRYELGVDRVPRQGEFVNRDVKCLRHGRLPVVARLPVVRRAVVPEPVVELARKLWAA